jgi:hypothetical protein
MLDLQDPLSCEIPPASQPHNLACGASRFSRELQAEPDRGIETLIHITYFCETEEDRPQYRPQYSKPPADLKENFIRRLAGGWPTYFNWNTAQLGHNWKEFLYSPDIFLSSRQVLFQFCVLYI